ncbi:hypothetical protein ACEWY4_000755 [Coilia grayii]|uniref:C2 domain-containing protein n=1 Tax=Coilia grayii TaxID=363190 RepID=A0ABD1KXK8_9TELE
MFKMKIYIFVTFIHRNLLDMDTFSKSDPVVVLYVQGIGTKEWREFGRTEVIDNTLNPDFVRKFVLDYFFEEKQNLRFDVYNVDTRSSNMSKHESFLGQTFCTLGEIIGSKGSRQERNLSGIPGKKCGIIILTAEELSNCRDIATMQLCANKLDKKDFFGKSDPFLVFYRSNEDGTFTISHKTEVIKNTLNPVWQTFTIPVRALCNGDYDRTVKVDVYDWDRDGSHDFIGEFTTSYRELSRGQSQFNVYEVLNPKKKCRKKKYINSGTVTLLSFKVESEYTFLDFIRGGTQLNFTVAIDFTASNGNPSQPTSLHYISPYQMNAYAMALKAVGEIIQDYDSDKLFPAYGFGAKLPPDGKVSHAFPLCSTDWVLKSVMTAVSPFITPPCRQPSASAVCISHPPCDHRVLCLFQLLMLFICIQQQATAYFTAKVCFFYFHSFDVASGFWKHTPTRKHNFTPMTTLTVFPPTNVEKREFGCTSVSTQCGI